MRRRTAESAWARLPIAYTATVTVCDGSEPKQDDVPLGALKK